MILMDDSANQYPLLLQDNQSSIEAAAANAQFVAAAPFRKKISSNIVDANGSVVVRYDYDIFGAITAVKNGSNQTITDTTSIAFLNPLCYRGYVYDDETGLYYLQSRYYDPVTGRFINADMYADTGSGSPLSTNMFAYCENNALLRRDIFGFDYLLERYWYQGTYEDKWNNYEEYFVYKTLNMNRYNCYSYANGKNQGFLIPGSRGRSVSNSGNRKYNINDVFNAIKQDLYTMGIRYRIGGKNSKLNKGEYLIAIRVANITGYDSSGGRTKNVNDFHLIKQDPNTKEWWGKLGDSYVLRLGKINPDNTKCWAMYIRKSKRPYIQQDYYFDYWGRVFYYYYNSSTRYLIIRRSFWSLEG